MSQIQFGAAAIVRITKWMPASNPNLLKSKHIQGIPPRFGIIQRCKIIQKAYSDSRFREQQNWKSDNVVSLNFNEPLQDLELSDLTALQDH